MELNEILVASPSNVNMSRKSLNMKNFEILEEGPQVAQDVNIRNLAIFEEGSQMSQDLSIRNLQILEEGPRVCPLCSQEIRMYFINYSEKIEMCENLECDYPFGYEPLKILREEDGVQTMEVKSITAKGTRSKAYSQASSQSWSDVDKLSNAFEPDDVSGLDFNRLEPTLQLKKTESERRREELLENVEIIKQMSKNMSDVRKESKRIIKNKKWIKNLEYLQSLSGFSLLKPAEMKKIKKKTAPPGTGELKIDIEKNNSGSITIEVNRALAPDTTLV